MEENSSQPIPKQNWYSLGVPDTFGKIIWTSALAVTGLSILDLAGWMLHISVLKSVIPNWEAMKVITSICLIFATTALVLIRLNIPYFLRRILPGILAFFIIIISLITLYYYLFIIETGNEPSANLVLYLDFIISPEKRMALLTAFNLLITGLAILLFAADKKRTAGLAHILILPVILVTYYTIVSYILGIYNATQIMNVSVAMNTGIGFFFLCLIVLSMKPDTWLLKAYTSQQIGGVIARRLLPILMILPVFIGWVRIKGEHAGLFKSDQGIVFVAMAYTISFLILIWVTARSVNNLDSRRRILDTG